ncbi:MAG: hypothetical protein AAGA03_12695, partial [Planctomycetota bacterium]
IDRMVENESELAGLTRFLTEFLISRGNDDVEALNQAEAAMLQAADSLAAANFAIALDQEQTALRSLAEARRTLEVFLSTQLSNRQQQALRRFARQLRQKLRRDPPESEREIADALKRIASEQRQLGNKAQALASTISSTANPSAAGKAGGEADRMADAESNPEDAESEVAATPTSNDEKTPEGETPGDATAPEDASAEETKVDEAVGEEADGDQPADRELTFEEQMASLYEDQIDLLERVEAIKEQLADRLADSDLMSARMDEAEQALDDLATLARQSEAKELSRQSQTAADQLSELGVQLEALSAFEPVARVSSVRDLTASMSKLELEVSDTVREALQENEGGQQGESDSTTAADARGESENGVAEERTEMRRRLGRQLRRRAETIEDVLRSPTEVGDIEMSEVNDRLQAFMEETDFLTDLEQSREVETELDADELTRSVGENAIERATRYAEFAQQLDQIYQQLVTPRLSRLRQLERQANRLARQLNGASGQPQEDQPRNRAGVGGLARQLKEEGLAKLAELLEQANDPAEETSDASEALRSDGSGEDYSPLGQGVGGRVQLVVKELRERIQEVLLLEISVDRDAPVPVQYRRAVDGYLRRIVGDASATSDMPQSGEKTP